MEIVSKRTWFTDKSTISDGNAVNSNSATLGTTDNRSLLFKTNNTQRLKIDSTGVSTFITPTTSLYYGTKFTNGTITAAMSQFSDLGAYNGAWLGTNSTHNFHLYTNGDVGGLPAITISSLTSGAVAGVMINGGSTTYTTNSSLKVSAGGGSNILRLTNAANTVDYLTVNSSGNMSVSSTATLNAAKINNTLTVGNTSTLTGGNSGTLAVLSDALFSLYFQQTATSTFVDGSTAYMSSAPISLLSSATSGTLLIPANCTLIGYTFSGYIAGTLASAENTTLSIRVNNTTDYELTNSLKYNTVDIGYSSNSLNNNYNAGDVISPKFVFPNFATNPTSIYGSVTLIFRRRL